MLVGRGLHTMPFLSRSGHPLVYAVDRHSRFVAWRELLPEVPVSQVKAELRAALDKADPASPPNQQVA